MDESWPATGVRTSFYARDKAEVERILDAFEREHPEARAVRLRSALIFKREAASGSRRLFAGPFLPTFLLRRRLLPVVPNVPGLRVQAVHSADIAEAYRLALHADVRGAFNVAAEPVLDPPMVARLLGARLVPFPARALRAGASLAWRLRLQPSPPGWVDMGLGVPLMSFARAERELEWAPARGADEAFLELLAGMREGAGAPTPPLDPKAGGAARKRELATGVGDRDN